MSPRHLLVLFLLLLISAPLRAQWWDFQSPRIPRTEDGKIDITAPLPKHPDGHWDVSGTWTPVESRGSFFDPKKLKPWAAEKMAQAQASFLRDDPRFHCLPSGPGYYTAGISLGGQRRMVYHPDLIVVLHGEMIFRQVYMDRALPEEMILPAWMGYSVGYWDGDVLVIESNGYKDTTWLTREGMPHTEQLHIVERYRRKDFGHMELEITYTDPGTFTEPVKAYVDMEYRESTMMESICNESTQVRAYMSGEIEQAEKKIVEISEATLKKYVGNYEGRWLGQPVKVEIVLEDDGLHLIRTPRYIDAGSEAESQKNRLVALSETAFDCENGLGFVFKLNKDGEVTGVSEVHVSGEWIFDRIN